MKKTFVAVALGLVLCASVVKAQKPESIGPVNIQVQAQFVSVQKADSDTLLAGAVGTIPNKDKILELVKKGKAKIVGAPCATSLSGSPVTVKNVEEVVYSTELDIQYPQTNVVSSEASALVVVAPTDFQMREVGTILECNSEVDPDGSIRVTLSPALVGKPTWKNYKATCIMANGKTIEVEHEQPFFLSQGVSTTLKIAQGAMVVAGGGIQNPTGDEVTYLLVTASVVDDAGNPQSKGHSPSKGNSLGKE